MPRTTTPRRAFTLIEMLVVIGIIALLLGLLAPALSGVQKRSRKTSEQNDLRSIGQAWTLYSNNNEDRALPGYIDADVQTAWRMNTRFVDKTPVAPADAAPWVWRLMPYMNNNPQIVHGYLHEDDNMQDMMAEAGAASLTPAFGYNSYFVGGWWELATMPEGEIRPQPRYWDATDADGNSLELIERSIAGIQRSTEVVIFCSAALKPAGIYRAKSQLLNEPGWHFVEPPMLGDVARWGRVVGGSGGGGGGTFQAGQMDGDVTTINVFADDVSVPIGRHTGKVVSVAADGHTEIAEPGNYVDMRKWIDFAIDRNFTFTP